MGLGWVGQDRVRVGGGMGRDWVALGWAGVG